MASFSSTYILFKLFFLVLLQVKIVSACIGGGLGGRDDRIITNPTFTWTMYPPVDWTYPEPNAITKDAALIGQSLTQADATNRANGDITAAALEALSTSNIYSPGVKIRPVYTPPLISNCEKVTPGLPIGGIFGIVEQGAVTQKATAVVAISDAVCISRVFPAASITITPFDVQRASVQIEGISVSEFQLEQVASQIQNNLNFNSRVRFVTPVVVNN